MSKTLQQIIDEQRQLSPLSKVSDAHISRVLTNLNRIGDENFSKACSNAQQTVWDDPSKGQTRRAKIKDNWSNNSSKLLASRKKEIQVPWGRFESRILAEQQGKDAGIKQVAQVIREGLENDTANFFYIGKKKKTMPEEARLRMVETKKKNGSKNQVKIKTPYGIFDTKAETKKIMKEKGIPNPRITLEKFLKDPLSGYSII